MKDYQQRVGSPLLNIADVEWLGTLTESDTRSLIVQRSQNEGVPLTESGYNRILDWAGYHPYLTQQLINEIFDDYQMGKSRSTESFMLHQQRKHDRDFSAWWDEDQRSYGFSQLEETVYRTLVQQREGTAETLAEQAQFSFGQVADALEVLTGTGVIRQLDDERYTMGSKLFEEWVVRERR
ncbi:helix-turn-helix domain-containing protein [Coleofasciculus sp. F4-SAH-05]|uniref:helix-turn-helix domain-containing protein n=1 Tax=Coleofasciculus sp. F4-SAH-05 TaxID=3069525 RepID=UPI0032F64BDE